MWQPQLFEAKDIIATSITKRALLEKRALFVKTYSFGPLVPQSCLNGIVVM
jgi:hypothetical protein